MNMVDRSIRLTTALFAVAIIVGCAHPISLTPDLAALEPVQGQARSTKAVGLFLNAADRQLTVESPGGGGDKVSYFPYRDLETGLYRMLADVYREVTIVSSPTDQDAILKHGLSFVFVPRLVTNSSSSSMLTWPPTRFSVELTCRVLDATGKEVASKRVLGEGQAEFDEFKRDFSLSAKRASLDAIRKMRAALLESPELR